MHTRRAAPGLFSRVPLLFILFSFSFFSHHNHKKKRVVFSFLFPLFSLSLSLSLLLLTKYPDYYSHVILISIVGFYLTFLVFKRSAISNTTSATQPASSSFAPTSRPQYNPNAMLSVINTNSMGVFAYQRLPLSLGIFGTANAVSFGDLNGKWGVILWALFKSRCFVG